MSDSTNPLSLVGNSHSQPNSMAVLYPNHSSCSPKTAFSPPLLFFGPAHPQVALLHSFNITNHLFCVNGVFIGDDTDACSSIQALFARVEEAKDVDGMKRKRLWRDAVKKHVHRGGATVSSVTRMFP